ncbi:hypothetical protein EJ06DRAFT_268877 [Trichodelitschia bisporula]|uniref:Uncharacterized protein n=1 Tax=Trichodelitschia bisporula TaxID=703511 RepID=A0A6G1HIA9_9PEZI|nr:hypothetical protein EJ06DRAFT_268877 [Trichodelitschia bisporula]
MQCCKSSHITDPRPEDHKRTHRVHPMRRTCVLLRPRHQVRITWLRPWMPRIASRVLSVYKYSARETADITGVEPPVSGAGGERCCGIVKVSEHQRGPGLRSRPRNGCLCSILRALIRGEVRGSHGRAAPESEGGPLILRIPSRRDEQAALA